MPRYDPARDCFTSDPPPAPQTASAPDRKRKPDADAPSSPTTTTTTTNHGPSLPTHHPSSPPPHPPSSSSPPKHPLPPPPLQQPPPPPQQQQRKRKASPDPPPKSSLPGSASSSNVKRPRRSDPPSHSSSTKYRYNSPPPPLIPKGKGVASDPTPPQSRAASPPRPRKRPGAASRLSEAEKAAIRRREEILAARKAAEEKAKAEEAAASRVRDAVRSHYNDKRELGKTWRTTLSRIKGLRSFNNWVKSTLIHKFSPAPNFDPRAPLSRDPNDLLVVLDMGCGKGGDLLKWRFAPQEVGFYLGLDHADVSIAHARDRYEGMARDARRGRRGSRNLFQAEFHALDCWTVPVDAVPIARRIGWDGNVGPGANRMAARWGAGGGFDVVSMMFCMHYAFETESKCRTMLRNVAGALKRGGRFIGTIPSSDVLSTQVKNVSSPSAEYGTQEWGNGIYKIKFSAPPPKTGIFRPTWGWEYNFFLEEAVEEVPEYVVPWEAFRGIAEDYGLELEYRKPFHDVWREEKEDRELKGLSVRMGVRDSDGRLALSDEEWEACGIYLAFAFRKT